MADDPSIRPPQGVSSKELHEAVRLAQENSKEIAAFRKEARQAEVRRARVEAPGARRPVEPARAPVEPARAPTRRTRAAVQAEIRREAQIAEQYAASLTSQGKNPARSSVARGQQARLAELRAELDVIKQQTAAEAAQVMVAKHQSAAEAEKLAILRQQQASGPSVREGALGRGRVTPISEPLSARTLRPRASIVADIKRETQIRDQYTAELQKRAEGLGRTSNPQSSSVYRDQQKHLGELREELALLDQQTAALERQAIAARKANEEIARGGAVARPRATAQAQRAAEQERLAALTPAQRVPPTGVVPGRAYTPGGAVRPRTATDIEADIQRQTRIAEQKAASLEAEGKNPNRSSVVRGQRERLTTLRQELQVLNEQTAAEAQQLQLLEQQVIASREKRGAIGANREIARGGAVAPAVQPAERPLPAALRSPSDVRAERVAQEYALAERRRPAPAQAPPPLVRGPDAYSNRVNTEQQKVNAEQQKAAAERRGAEEKLATQRLATEEKASKARLEGLRKIHAKEAELSAARLASEEKTRAKRAAGLLTSTGRRVPLTIEELNEKESPARLGRGVLHYGQRVYDPTAPDGTTGAGSPQLGIQGSGRKGVPDAAQVQRFQRNPTIALQSIEEVEKAKKSLPAFYQQLQRGSVIQAQASQQMRRHGALTTEFLQALARGETTLSEFRFQIGSTIAKFAGWTLAATSVYGVVGAISVLGRGAKDSLSGVQQLNRFITDVDTSRATQGFRNVSREVNVSIGEVAGAQANFLRVYHDQDQALTAARTALKLTKLDNLSAADSLRFLTASAQEFQLPASQIVVLGDKLANVFRTMGVPIQESLPAFARSAAVVRNAGGDLTELIELIAIARRQTGQTGNTIGTAISRSAANFVNRPSSQATFKQLGLDPKKASDDYTAFVLSAVKRAKTLNAVQIRELAAAIGGPQYGARIFTGLLRGYRLLPQAAKAAGDESAGTLDRELKVKLKQVDEQLSAVANGMERLGSALASSGAFAPLGIALKTLNLMLTLATDLTSAFSHIPEPFKQMSIYLGEAYLALKLLRRTGIGPGLAERNANLGFLGYSPRDQLRRGAIATERNVGAGLANRAEQLGNQYQIATQSQVIAAENAIRAQGEVVALSNVKNVNQKLVNQAEQRAIAYSEESVRYGREAVALNEEIALVAQLRAGSEARLVGYQKRTLLPSQGAQQQGGSLSILGRSGKPETVTTAQAKDIEGGRTNVGGAKVAIDKATAAEGQAAAQTGALAASYEKFALANGATVTVMTSQTAAAREVEAAAARAARATAEAAVQAKALAVSAEQAAALADSAGISIEAAAARLERAAAANARLAAGLTTEGAAASSLAKTAATVEAAAVAAGVTSEVAAAELAVESVGIRAAAAGQGRLAASFASFRRGVGQAVALGRSAAAGALRFLSSPLTLALIAFEAIPAIIDAQKDYYKKLNESLDTLSADTSSHGSLKQERAFLDAHKPPEEPGLVNKGIRGVTHAYNPLQVEQDRQGRQQQREAYKRREEDLAAREKAQDHAFATGAPVPFLTIGKAAQRLNRSVRDYQQGSSSVADLTAAYRKYEVEIRHSAEATAGGAKASKKVAAAISAGRVAILAVVDGAKAIAEALKGSSLAEIAGALQLQTEQIKVFGIGPKQEHRISAEYAVAAKKLSDDPTAANLKAYGVARQAIDAALQEAQTKLQQALAVATTGPQRSAAYQQYFKSLEKSSGLADVRSQIRASRDSSAGVKAKIKAAEKKQQDLQEEYNAAKLQAPNPYDKPGPGGNENKDFQKSFGLNTGEIDKPFGGENRSDASEKELKDQKKKVDDLHDKLKKGGANIKKLRQLYKKNKADYDALVAATKQQYAQTENQVGDLQAQLEAGRTADPVRAINIQLAAAHKALNRDVRAHVAEEQRLQDRLKIQGLEDQQLQAQVQQIQNRGALQTSRIDPINTTAVDRSNLSNLYAQLRAARAGRPGPANTDLQNQILTQINQARFQQAQNVRQTAQAENDAYYAYLKAGVGSLHPVKLAQLEYQRALTALQYAHGKAERLQALAAIATAREGVAEALHQNAIDETNAYFGLAESKTTDPLRTAQLEYRKAQRLHNQARGRKEGQQTQIDKNNALKTLNQTIVDERLKTIDFEASIGKISSDQEIRALKGLLKLKKLTKDTKRQILQQIYQLEHTDDTSAIELNVGNIRLPTLYDVRRLAAGGLQGNVTMHQTINNHNQIAKSADAEDVGRVMENHTRAAFSSALRKLGSGVV